jgi:hypothetical protein
MKVSAKELRRKAALCRRAASVPTTGSTNADRILLELAEQLEREAELREQQSPNSGSNSRPDSRIDSPGS